MMKNRVLTSTLVGFVIGITVCTIHQMSLGTSLQHESVHVMDQIPINTYACLPSPPFTPLDYGFCDDHFKSLNLSLLNVTVHFFESSIFIHPWNNTTQVHILAFVQDAVVQLSAVSSAGQISNKTQFITFHGFIDEQKISIRKRKPFWGGLLLLEADVELPQPHPSKIQLYLTLQTLEEEAHIMLEMCKQPPKKTYNTAVVLKPTFSAKIKPRHIYEWIAHHLNVGIEHFILYSRNETYDAGFQPLIDHGIVTWKYFPPFAKFARPQIDQEVIYTHALMQNRYNIKWLFYFDLDEYLISSIRLDWLLRMLECEPAVLLQRINFASDTPQYGNFLFEKWIMRDWTEFWDTEKTVVQSRFAWWMEIHFPYLDGYVNLRYQSQPTEYPVNAYFPLNIQKARFNHYRKAFFNRNDYYTIHNPVLDESALFYVPYLNQTYNILTECMNGNATVCKSLTKMKLVHLPQQE